MTKNIGGMMSTVFKTAPLEVYDDPYAGRWVRSRKGWTDGGFEATLEGLADKGELRLYEGWAAAVRAKRLWNTT